ncbi:MAG: hypothetical protein M5U34_13825 [Chloroflexi bacterium]|nr:hypothetical protein [Chloroflexota bacterium]
MWAGWLTAPMCRWRCWTDKRRLANGGRRLNRMTIFGDVSRAYEWPRAILHLDMDAFYVNVHLLDAPADSGIPLVVGETKCAGVVTSASYEAREKGVRSAMPMATAVRLCPGLKIVPPDWTRIRECSRQVMEKLHEYGPVEQISVDEAYIDLGEVDDPLSVAAEVGTAVFTQTHLPASVGLATSKLVAKVASDHEKPQGAPLCCPVLSLFSFRPCPCASFGALVHAPLKNWRP